MKQPSVIDVNPGNVTVQTLFCIKDTKSPGFQKKKNWFTERHKEGLKLKILYNESGKPAAFIEYIPAEYAWRPVKAPGYMFIHCMFTYSNKDKQKGYGALLVSACEEDAKKAEMAGVCVMTSKGSWMTDKRLFLKNGYRVTETKGRFELMTKKFMEKAADPSLIDWTKEQKQYKGWHLLYADQCPWHEKSAEALKKTAEEAGIDMKIHRIATAAEAQQSPSGTGVFSLMHDGRLLEDHYISRTRFLNILKKELEV